MPGFVQQRSQGLVLHQLISPSCMTHHPSLPVCSSSCGPFPCHCHPPHPPLFPPGDKHPLALFNPLFNPLAPALGKPGVWASPAPGKRDVLSALLCTSTQISPSQLHLLTHLQQMPLPEDLWQPAIWGEHSPRMLIQRFSTG